MPMKSILLAIAAACSVLIYPIHGYCADKDKPGFSAEEDIRSVLQHGNLADTEYLSEKLGLGLKIRPPNANAPWMLQGIFYNNPDYLFATGLSYQANFDEHNDVTRISLILPFIACPGLGAWARDWDKSVDITGGLDGVGPTLSIKWPSSDQITLYVTYNRKNDCRGGLMQVIKGKISPHLADETKSRSNGNTLAQAVAGILSNGDLRDYQNMASAIHAHLISRLSDDGNLEFNELAKPIPELDARGFSYWVADTGWMTPPSWFRDPSHLAERRASLSLVPNLIDMCLSVSDILKALDQRSIRYQVDETKDSELKISTKGKNLISVAVFSSDECVSSITFDQKTDIANALESPVVFALDASLDSSKERLNEAAITQIDALVRRTIHWPKFEKIDIYENLPLDKSSVRIEKARKLASVIRDALIAGGVHFEQIDLHDESVPIPLWIASFEKRQHEAGIFLDPVSKF